MKLPPPFVVVAGLLAMPFAHAAPPSLEGWYGGVAAGQSSVDVQTGDWNDGTLTGMRLDGEGFAYKVIAGYRFTPRFAIEGGYVELGDTGFSATEPGPVPTVWQIGPVMGKATAKGVSVEGVFTWPFLQRWAVFAKGGLFMWDTTFLSRPTISGGTLALGDEIRANDDGIRWMYGAGVDRRVYQNWRVRLEWEHAEVRFKGTANREVSLPTLGVTLDF